MRGRVALYLLLISNTLLAADPDWVNVTRAEDNGVKSGSLRAENFRLQPMLGFLDYRSTRSGDSGRLQRAIGGLIFDYNAMSWFDSDSPQYYLGASSGGLYSKVTGRGESDFVSIPVNIKAGYHSNDRFRISVRGGGNVVYRSDAAAMNFSSDDLKNESLWKMYPNAGLDLEFGLGRGIIFSLRSDWTFGKDDTVFSGLVGFGIMI